MTWNQLYMISGRTQTKVNVEPKKAKNEKLSTAE